MFYLVYFHWQSMHYLITFKNQIFNLKNILLIQFFILNAITTDLFWLWMVAIDCICSSIVIAYSLIFFISMKQTNALLLTNKSKFNFRVFELFKRNHTTILTQVLYSNLFCGYLLTAYLGCVIPINTLAVIGLITGQFNPVTQYFHISITILVYVAFVLIHLLGATFSSTIHKCSKHLLRLSIKSQNWNIYQRIRLFLYYEKFLVKKKYGLTYLSHSVMSAKSFAKVYPFSLCFCNFSNCIFF